MIAVTRGCDRSHKKKEFRSQKPEARMLYVKLMLKMILVSIEKLRRRFWILDSVF
jgi:hypothetical protein